MLQQCHIWAKDKLHWIYMAHKVCQTVVHVWQSMKTCHKRKAKKIKEQKIWLMSGCVCHVSVRRSQREGGGLHHMCIYNAYIRWFNRNHSWQW